MLSIKQELIFGLVVSLLIGIATFWYIREYKVFSSKRTAAIAQNVSASRLTMRDVSQHATADDCWMVIDGKVLDVTTYINLHPGGTQGISNYCGKDASQAFKAIKDGEGHSNQAVALFAQFLLGLVEVTIE